MHAILIFTLSFLFVGCNSSSFRIEGADSVVVTPAPGAFNLTAATQGNSSIILNWSSSQDAATYVVKYGTVTGNYSTVASVNATSPYVVTGLINGVEYFFRVEAVNSVGSELSSSELSESVIFLDEFTTLDLITTWQLGDNPSSYSFTEWSQVYGGPGGIVFNSDGNNLTIGNITTASGVHTQTLETRQAFNFTDSWVSTDLNTPATINAGRDEESGLWVIDPAGDGWTMYKYGTDLWYGRSFNSGIDQATIPFDPVNHRFMRIRHSSVGDLIYFEVSPDDLVWTTLPVAKSRSGENISNVHLMLFGFGNNNGNGPSGSPLGIFSWIKSNAPIN